MADGGKPWVAITVGVVAAIGGIVGAMIATRGSRSPCQPNEWSDRCPPCPASQQGWRRCLDSGEWGSCDCKQREEANGGKDARTASLASVGGMINTEQLQPPSSRSLPQDGLSNHGQPEEAPLRSLHIDDIAKMTPAMQKQFRARIQTATDEDLAVLVDRFDAELKAAIDAVNRCSSAQAEEVTLKRSRLEDPVLQSEFEEYVKKMKLLFKEVASYHRTAVAANQVVMAVRRDRRNGKPPMSPDRLTAIWRGNKYNEFMSIDRAAAPREPSLFQPDFLAPMAECKEFDFRNVRLLPIAGAGN